MLGFVRRRRVNDAVNKIMGKRPILTRYVFLLLACLIIAFAFNIFFLKNDIVCFGVSGLSIVLNQFGVKPSLFILITNMILLIIAYFVLGKDFALKSMVGSILFPICISITEVFIPIINFDDVEKIILAIMGAVLSGIGYGLVYKSGYTTGGTDIINQIISKYTHITVGKAMRITDGLIVLSSKLVFTWETILYGYVVLYIITTLSDKILFGRSKCKTFYIVTEHYDEVKEYMSLLKAYYKEQGSIQAVSDSLYIHKNTLQYRIGKLKELTGYDVRKPSENPALYMAYLIMQDIEMEKSDTYALLHETK